MLPLFNDKANPTLSMALPPDFETGALSRNLHKPLWHGSRHILDRNTKPCTRVPAAHWLPIYETPAMTWLTSHRTELSGLQMALSGSKGENSCFFALDDSVTPWLLRGRHIIARWVEATPFPVVPGLLALCSNPRAPRHHAALWPSAANG